MTQQYILNSAIPSTHFIEIEYSFSAKANNPKVYLPKWRPGRYELGNFAKNVQQIVFLDQEGEPLEFKKIETHTWTVSAKKGDVVTARYRYYAADLNAGSTFVSSQMLFVNPVNCLVYQEGALDEQAVLQCNVPARFKFATGLKSKTKGVFEVSDLHTLFDSPIMSGPKLHTHQLDFDGADCFLHFLDYDIPRNQKDRVIADFQKFFVTQYHQFKGFPTQDYHFLFMLTPFTAHHGVEHGNSTVIVLGPVYKVFESDYEEFMGISSHELFHTWNVKAFRDATMTPYNYQMENYSTMGYVAEGVTTWMGDLMLTRSGVFDTKTFLIKQLEGFIKRHIDNPARTNNSVAASSFDTWLDGYEAGVPGKKVSIYNEGALLAFCMDVLIAKHSKFKHTLMSVMRDMYEDESIRKNGYSEEVYIQLISKYAGKDLSGLFSKYVNGTEDYMNLIEEVFEFLNLELDLVPSTHIHESVFGMKLNHTDVKQIYRGSIAQKAGLWSGDKILSINTVEAGADLANWISFYQDEEINLVVSRGGRVFETKMKANGKTYFQVPSISISPEAFEDGSNLKNYIHWVPAKKK